VFKVGEIILFNSPEAGKPKLHLCISFSNRFLFVNSPKQKIFFGDFEIDGARLTGVPPTPTGKSIISCNTVLKYTDDELTRLRARAVGSLDADTIRDLLEFVENLETLSPDDRNAILDGLGDWC
jgi:hypothetical protein